MTKAATWNNPTSRSFQLLDGSMLMRMGSSNAASRASSSFSSIFWKRLFVSGKKIHPAERGHSLAPRRHAHTVLARDSAALWWQRVHDWRVVASGSWRQLAAAAMLM
jgi:hypothetical protein